ncbi:hypothetical protein D3C85_1214050 [compost metagenome]
MAMISKVKLTQPSSTWMAIRKRRRSRMSDSTPAGMANRNTGKVAAVCIMATAAGLLDRSVTSQALATSRMKLPILPRMVAPHSTANSVCFKGAMPPTAAGGVLRSGPAMQALRQVMPGDQDECPGQPQVFIERVHCHEARVGGGFPIAVGHQGRYGGE